MAAPTTFATVETGRQFTVDGHHAKEDGTALIFTKISDTAAQDDTGRVWNFTLCLGLICNER